MAKVRQAHSPKTPMTPLDVVSAKPTAAKLGIKPAQTVCVLGSPTGFVDRLKPRPAKVTFTARPDKACGLFLCFVRSTRELHAQLLALRETIDRRTLWMIWPKKASAVKSDLDGNIVREAGLSAGWVDFKVCAVDSTWSGLAFKRKK